MNGATLAALSALSWGSAMVMSKAALADFPPAALLAVQLAASCAALFGWIVLSPQRGTGLGRAFRHSWLGLLEPGAAYLLGLTGLADIAAGAAGIIQASESIMILALSAAFMGERLPRRFAMLAMVAFAGIVIATVPQSGAALAGSLSGDGLVFAGTFVAALYVVLSARLAVSEDPVRLVAAQHVVALLLALAALPFVWSPGTVSALRALPGSAWAFALASGVIQYALAFSLYLAAMRRVSAGIAGAFLNLIPIVGIAGAAAFLDERVSVPEAAGAAITMSALVFLGRARRAAQAYALQTGD